jgi:hypothetical protein
MYENVHKNPKIEHFFFSVLLEAYSKLQNNSLLYFLAQKVHSWTSNKNFYYD